MMYQVQLAGDLVHRLKLRPHDQTSRYRNI